MVYSIIEHTIIVIIHNLLKKHIVGSEKNKKNKERYWQKGKKYDII